MFTTAPPVNCSGSTTANAVNILRDNLLIPLFKIGVLTQRWLKTVNKERATSIVYQCTVNFYKYLPI